MRHPIEKYNKQQAAVLASLPKGQREYMARMFRIGNATYCYYNHIKDLPAFGDSHEQVASSVDLVDWLEQQINRATDRPKSESRSARELLQIYFDRTADAGVSGRVTP